MNVGDRVKTSAEWNDKYMKEGLTGTVLKVERRGPIYPERNHYVDLDKEFKPRPGSKVTAGTYRLWFDPDHLQPEDG
jgi:hypothetical protein